MAEHCSEPGMPVREDFVVVVAEALERYSAIASEVLLTVCMVTNLKPRKPS